MERREFLGVLTAAASTLTFVQMDSLLAATGFHQEGPYNGPLLNSYVNSTCGACPGGCGIRVRKVDGVPVRIDGNPIHPLNRGGLCPVGISALSLLVHPDRIKQPLLRSGPRGSGEYRAISWDEAENLIAEKLTELQQGGTPEQLLFLDSRKAGPGLELARKFTHDLGSPNFYNSYDPNTDTAASIWGGAGTTFGYDLENARNIFCFGYPVFEAGPNPVYYAGLRQRLLSRQEGERGSFIIIDPRLSSSAANSERWVPIKPATYGLLALGMLYFIIKEKLYDSTRAERNFVRFEDYKDKNGRTLDGFKSFVLKNYFPSFVSGKTGVPVDQIIMLARLFATTPKSIAIPGASVAQTKDGVYQSWAIMALNSLAGNFGSVGAVGTFRTPPYGTPSFKKVKKRKIVSSSSPEYLYLAGLGSIESLPDAILQGTPYPVKVAIFNNINPVFDSPQSDRFKQALQNIPFSVAFTDRSNETSALADLVLPDCTFLEKNDLSVPDSDFPHSVVGATQPVIEPLYDSRQVDETILSLGKRLNKEKWGRWENYRSYLEGVLQEIYKSGSGTLFTDEFTVSFESLLAERGWRREEFKDFNDFNAQFLQKGGWWDTLGLPESDESRIPSSSGKFFFVSRSLRNKLTASKKSLQDVAEAAELKIDPSSVYILGAFRKFTEEEDVQYPLSLYPFELITLRGAGARMDSMADMVGYYQDIKWKSWVELNPESAHELGLHEGQMVWVESTRGRKRVMLRIEPGLMPGVAATPLGFGGKGSRTFGKNMGEILTTERDFLTGAPAIAETRVRVYA